MNTQTAVSHHELGRTLNYCSEVVSKVMSVTAVRHSIHLQTTTVLSCDVNFRYDLY